MLKLLIVFNLVDALFTLLYIHLGVAYEANPIMEFYHSINPVLFVLVKNGIFFAAVYLLSQGLKYKLVQHTIYTFTFGYGLLVGYHLLLFKSAGWAFVSNGAVVLASRLLGL